MRRVAFWDCEFESRSGYWCLLRVFCVVGYRSLRGVVHSSRESCRLRWVVVCDLDTSTMRGPWPTLNRKATKKCMYACLCVYVCMYVCMQVDKNFLHYIHYLNFLPLLLQARSLIQHRRPINLAIKNVVKQHTKIPSWEHQISQHTFSLIWRVFITSRGKIPRIDDIRKCTL